MKTKSASENELALLIQLKDGDRKAFEQIYHRYKLPLSSSLLRVLKSPELAEEVLQDIFLTIWEHRQRIDPQENFKAYLFKIASNMANKIFRKAYYDQDLRDRLFSTQAYSYSHIEETILKKENQQLLLDILDKLPPKRKEVYILCKLESKSYEEVAQLLNITKGTVNDHIRKANLFLKDYLSGKEDLLLTLFLVSALHSLV